MDLEAIVGKFKAGASGVEGFDQPESLLEYAQQIQNILSGNPPISKLDYYLGLTFPDSETDGLLPFLQKTIVDKKYDKVKELILNLVQYVLVQKAWSSDVNRFCLRFKTAADRYWKNNKVSARLQQASLECLVSLYENHTVDSTDFETSQLFWALLPKTEKSSYQPTVRGKMFHLLGVIGALSQDMFKKQEGSFKQVFNHMTATVKTQVISGDSHLEVSILLGCIKGINKLLNVYGEEINSGEESWILFQEHLEQIVDPFTSIAKKDGKAKIKRREFQRAALQLIADHGALLKVGLFKKHRQWYEDLMEWSKSSNTDDNRIGRKAMNKFLDTVVEHSKYLKDLSADEMSEPPVPEVDSFLKFFSEKFKTVLTTKDVNRIELSIAVRGYGMLSNVCSDAYQAQEMLNLIMEHVNSIIQELESPTFDKYSASLSILTTYLESVANILPSLKSEDDTIKISEDHLDSIKRLTILLIRLYPELSEGQRNFCYISVQKICDSLWYNHHSLCEPFIEQVYRQSMLHIVSCPTRAEIDILIESYNKSNPNSKKSPYKQLGLKPVTFYVQFWKLLLSHGSTSSSDSLRFDLLMQWILTNIQKLDLTINFEENEVSESTLDPVQGATATVVKDFQIFVNIVDFLQELLSENKAIHRKFEKWVNVFANEMLGYIRNHAYVSGFYKILAVVFDAARSVQYFEVKDEERRALQNNLNVFFGKLGTKIREFRDDLLFAVLELWLSLPDELILSNFTALNNTLQTVFITGRNSFSLAIRGLEAIERWFFQPEFPVEEIKVIMNDIFPILKTYFVHSASTDAEAATSNKANAIDKSSRGKGKGVKDLIKKNIQFRKLGEDATLKKTQLKILQLIGNFGQFLQLSDKEHSGLAKDQRFLQYAIPFQDCKPEIFIDDFLPIVLELCESAVERQTRISACEFFHTIALIFIGRSREKFTTRLFKRIFESMLKLGCDSDIVVRQLFNPLCLQTIHWFSKRDSPYGAVVLDILTENLTQHQNPSLRELAALCFGEYFAWLLKHESPSSKGVLKTIFALSTHASVHYRQGSVLAFNSIYKDFREDKKSLVNEFSFNLLYSFLTSLKLSKDLPEDSLLVTSTRQSIKHLERILIKKKDLFNTGISRQFKPMTRHDTSGHPCLKNVVEWLLCQGGTTAAVYRNECLRLIKVFSQHVKDFRSTEICLTTWEETNGLDGWIRIAEENSHFAQTNIIPFLDASSEFYRFLFEFKILERALFSANSGSKFCESLLTLCSQIQPLSACTLSDEEKTQALNIFSRLEFAWKILDGEALANLWVCSMELSQNMASSCPLIVIEGLVKVWSFEEASEIVKNKCQSLLLFEPVEDFSTANEHSTVISLLALADWFKVVAEGGIMNRMLSPEVLISIKHKLWNSINQALFKHKPACSTSGESSTPSSNLLASNLNLNQKKIVENYLITAISLGLDPNLILDAVFDAVSVTQKDGSFLLVTTKGSVFQKQIMNGLVYCESLFQFDQLLKDRPIREVGELILRLLDVIKSDKILKMRFGTKIFKKIITNWKMISINCDMPTSVKIFVGLVTVDIEACKNSVELSSWWNGQGLMQARHLDLKQKAGVFGYATVFASSWNKKIIEVLTQTISTFIENELAPETMNWTDVDQYVNHVCRKLLQVSEQLISSNSTLLPAILTLLQKVCVWVKDTTDHPLFRMVRDSLEKMVKVLLGTDSDKVRLASELYELITSDGRKNRLYVESTPVWKSSLLPVVSSLGIATSKNFFKKYIYSIISTVQIKPTSEYDWHRKTVAVNLLELFVYQTSADFFKSGEISRAYWNKAPEEIKKNASAASLADDKTVFRSMIKVCAEGYTKLPNLPEDPALRNHMLTFSEACYNTIVAVVLEAKTAGKLCVGFLFPGPKMFENIIDTAQVYEIPVVIDEKRSEAGKMLFSRSRKKISSESTSYYGDPAMSILPRSGNLSGSSLEPEATSYDFTTTVTVSNSEYYQRIFGNQVDHGGNMQVGQAGNSLGDTGEQLEWNEINEHSCMFAFVETLKYMSGLHRSNDDGNRGWINNLVTILKNIRIHKNVKLFIVGGIINTPESVEPFAKDLVDPIAQLILSDCFGSVGLNHFVQDTILTLLSWHAIENSKPEPETVTSLLKYIIQHLDNDEVSKRKDVFGHVMVILQNIVKHWVGGLAEIPKDEVASLVSNSNLTDEGAFLFLNVSLNILLGGQLPHTDSGPLLKKFMKSVTSRFKGIYVAAAKCLGVFLKISKSQAPPDIFEKYVDDVKEKISTFKSKAPMFVDVLSAIQPNFPEIMVHCRNTILELCQFPKVRPQLLALLPLLLTEEFAGSTAEDYYSNGLAISGNKSCGDEFYTDIKGRGFFNLSQPCKSESELSSALDLLELLVDNTSYKSDLLDIVNWLNNSAEACSDSIVKVKFANCLLKLYEKLLRESMESTSPDNNLDSTRRRVFFRIFIRLYENEEEVVQEIVHKFWTTVLREWIQSSAQLLLELFDLIGEEEHPLNVCLGIMLQRCSFAPDYFKNIFLEPLENCDFHPFQLDTSWRLRNSSFQPLFSDSLSTAQNFTTLPRAMQNTLMSQRRSVGKFGMNVLRATLTNLQFTPTQQDERGNETSVSPMGIDYYTQNFQPGQGYGTISDYPNNQQQHNQSFLGSDGSPSSLSNPILKLRRKFYTRKEAMFYATIGSEKRSKKIEDAKELQLQKISGVKTVRSYRIGELPDILIPHSDFLKTLLKLARLDERVAQTFIIRLYRAMLTDMDSTQSRRFLSKSKDIFDRVLRNSLATSDRSFSSLLVELSVCNNISLPLTVILEVSKITHMQKLGILKLERELLNETESAVPGGQKRIKLPAAPNPHEVGLWLGLAEMYKEIEEYDVLRNIFVNIHQCPLVSGGKKELYETIGNALYLEGKGQLEKALELFDKAWESETEDEGGSTTTKYFLEDAMMHCLTQLGDWNTLYTSSLKFNGTLLDDVLQDQNVVERLIPSQMLAGMHLTLRHSDDGMDEDGEDEHGGRTNVSNFHEFVENFLSTEEGTSFMSIRYPFEAAAWFLVDNEEEYSHHAYIMQEKGYETTIANFKSFDRLSFKSQRQVIVALQQSSVIQDYLQWKKPYQDLRVVEERTKRLLGNWSKHLAYQPMDLIGSDYIGANRDCFASKIGLNLEEQQSEHGLLSSIQGLRVEQDIWLTNLGICHKNYNAAQTPLTRLITSGREDLKLVEYRKSMARFLAAFPAHFEKENWCKRWCQVWKKIDKIDCESEQTEVRGIKAALLLCALEAVDDEESGFVLAPIIKMLKGAPESSTLTSCIFNATEELMKSCNEASPSLAHHNGPIYAKLFHLMKKLTNNFNTADYKTAEKMMACLIGGTVEGSANDMLLLSNMFSLMKKFPDHFNATFETMAENIPTFLFLPWIDQIMTAYKASPEQYGQKSFKIVIDRLVKEFPQAFQIQYSEYLNTSQRLFAKALKAVVLPFKLHESQVNNIIMCQKEEELMAHLVEFQSSLQEIINNDSKIYGEYHMKYATEMFKVVNNTVSEYQRSSQSSESESENLSGSVSWCRKETGKIHRMHMTKVGDSTSISLEKLSPFLAEFHFFEHELIEKPGLYENFKRPRLQDHPVIVSFHPTVDIYKSLTRPLKLTVITNDGKKSNFLAKQGDDIRQDRRIQQLFKMSNVLLQKDAGVRQRKLAIETYSCIPISPVFGIIEMVDNVMSLADVMFDSSDLGAIRKRTIMDYDNWMWESSGLDRRASNPNPYAHYRCSAESSKRQQSTNFFNKISSRFPNYLLRDNIQKRSDNYQEFFSIRQNLIKSYGALCMVHWLLGIGDRHLENCLLSMDSGKLVGIDFGRAFGTSNYVILIPELVPFRLTPQLQQLMSPYTFRGLFRESCILTWSCLEGASDLILTVADVFIQEPSIDWLKLRPGSKSGQGQGQHQDGEHSEQAITQLDFPFEIMKRKLLNHNPTKLVIEELKKHPKRDLLGIYSKIAEDGRIHLEKDKLSDEEYVDVLLDLATDKNVLSRLFGGWNSWA